MKNFFARLTRPGRSLALAALLLFFLLQTQMPLLEAAARPANQDQQAEASQELIDRVAARLESASPVDRAWGAYLAQKNGLKQFIPNLIETLRTLNGDESPDAWLVTSGVIDSLIQLEADVPADVIMSLKPRFTDRKVILLARSPLANKDALLELMRNTSNIVWRAAGNLLAGVKAPGFAALLLNRLHISVSIYVVDPGTGGAGGGIGCGCAGDGFIAVPKDYPPIGFYGLSEQPVRGYVVLAPGPTTIYYYRVVVNSGAQTGWGHGCGNLDYDQAVIEYLAMLLDTAPDQVGLKSAESYSEQWRGAAALTRRLRQIRADATAKYHSVVSRLTEANLLSEPEAKELVPYIEIKVTDLRTDRSVPLPATAN
jgi:hypothetical protein